MLTHPIVTATVLHLSQWHSCTLQETPFASFPPARDIRIAQPSSHPSQFLVYMWAIQKAISHTCNTQDIQESSWHKLDKHHPLSPGRSGRMERPPHRNCSSELRCVKLCGFQAGAPTYSLAPEGIKVPECNHFPFMCYPCQLNIHTHNMFLKKKANKWYAHLSPWMSVSIRYRLVSSHT